MELEPLAPNTSQNKHRPLSEDLVRLVARYVGACEAAACYAPTSRGIHAAICRRWRALFPHSTPASSCGADAWALRAPEPSTLLDDALRAMAPASPDVAHHVKARRATASDGALLVTRGTSSHRTTRIASVAPEGQIRACVLRRDTVLVLRVAGDLTAHRLLGSSASVLVARFNDVAPFDAATTLTPVPGGAALLLKARSRNGGADVLYDVPLDADSEDESSGSGG
ncbi:hypothetical protein JL720_758 [Aureococcus anophagefferens]|nr:hypothetical protein JL720_758 [Aureococcus anophagefferens]